MRNKEEEKNKIIIRRTSIIRFNENLSGEPNVLIMKRHFDLISFVTSEIVFSNVIKHIDSQNRRENERKEDK